MNMDWTMIADRYEGRESLAYKVIGCAMRVYKTLGSGLLESIYEQALMIELDEAGIDADCQVPFKALYNGMELDGYFRVDVIVENELVLELKSVKEFEPVHFKQLRSYLRLLNKPMGYLINFNVSDFSVGKGWDRIYNEWYDEEKLPSVRMMKKRDAND